jgi:DNA-binding GntR family transcriptional regulator
MHIVKPFGGSAALASLTMPKHRMQYASMPSQRALGARSTADAPRNVLLPVTATPRVVRNAADVAAELIRQAIVEGRLHPGEPLREERLATELAISRTPIREALLILQTEGLVEAAPKRGSVVRSYEPAEIADLYETRALTEGYASGRAARFVTADHIRLLHQSCARFEALLEETDVVPLVKENLAFHSVILDASRSPTLAQLVSVVTRVPLIYRSYYHYSSKEKAIALHYHQRIAQALEQRDAARAEALMREHIFEARDILVANMGDGSVADGSKSPLRAG